MRLVTLPGLDGTGQLSAPFAAAAPLGCDVQSIAYPRHEVRSVTELVQLVRDELPTTPFVLLAESFSGLVAITLAAVPPPWLQGLVLVATAARWSRTAAFRLVRVTPLFALRPPASLLRYYALGRDATDHQVRAAQDAVASVSPRVLASRFLELARADVRPQLAAVRVPVLYVQGQQDRLARAQERHSIAAALPSATTIVINGPHCLLFTRPTEVWRHLRAFEPSLCAA
jgi:pimeloyl-[acyl-carrier protein] methyl ester esterase